MSRREESDHLKLSNTNWGNEFIPVVERINLKRLGTKILKCALFKHEESLALAVNLKSGRLVILSVDTGALIQDHEISMNLHNNTKLVYNSKFHCLFVIGEGAKLGKVDIMKNRIVWYKERVLLGRLEEANVVCTDGERCLAYIDGAVSFATTVKIMDIEKNVIEKKIKTKGQYVRSILEYNPRVLIVGARYFIYIVDVEMGEVKSEINFHRDDMVYSLAILKETPKNPEYLVCGSQLQVDVWKDFLTDKPSKVKKYLFKSQICKGFYIFLGVIRNLLVVWCSKKPFFMLDPIEGVYDNAVEYAGIEDKTVLEQHKPGQYHPNSTVFCGFAMGGKYVICSKSNATEEVIIRRNKCYEEDDECEEAKMDRKERVDYMKEDLLFSEEMKVFKISGGVDLILFRTLMLS